MSATTRWCCSTVRQQDAAEASCTRHYRDPLPPAAQPIPRRLAQMLEKIEELAANGIGAKAIAHQLDRKPEAMRSKIANLGLLATIR